MFWISDNLSFQWKNYCIVFEEQLVLWRMQMQFDLVARSAGSKQIFATDNFLFKYNTVISILMQDKDISLWL